MAESHTAQRSWLTYAVAAAAFVALVALLTRRTTSLPLHLGLLAMAVVIVTVPAAAGRLWWLDSSAGGSLPHLVRGLGAVLVGGQALGIVVSFRGGGGDVADRARAGLPLITSMLVLCAMGFLTLAARPGGRTATARAVVMGLAGAAVWLVVVALAPPLPESAALAMLCVGGAGAVAATLSRGRGALVAALGAGMITSLLVVLGVGLIMDFAPDRWVPNLVPVALSRADDLADSRVEASDAYVGLLLLGTLLGAALVAVTSTARLRRVLPTSEPPRAETAGSA